MGALRKKAWKVLSVEFLLFFLFKCRAKRAEQSRARQRVQDSLCDNMWTCLRAGFLSVTGQLQRWMNGSLTLCLPVQHSSSNDVALNHLTLYIRDSPIYCYMPSLLQRVPPLSSRISFPSIVSNKSFCVHIYLFIFIFQFWNVPSGHVSIQQWPLVLMSLPRHTSSSYISFLPL